MKRLIVALAVTAMAAVGFAEDWFTAGFGEGAESTGGNWVAEQAGVTAAPKWNDKTLVLTSSGDPVVFNADESKSVIDDTSVIVETSVGFVGCVDLPAIAVGAKTGICAMKGGNFFVVGYDGEGSSNKWVDTGIAAGGAGEIPVTLAVTNNVAWYTIDGTALGGIDISANYLGAVHYGGTGTVTRLEADNFSYEVDINLESAAIENLIATCKVTRAEVGATVEVQYLDGAKVSSDSTTWFKYKVLKNGDLELVEGQGELPKGIEAVVCVGSKPYGSLAAAVKELTAGDTLTFIADATNLNCTIEKDCTIDANGHVVIFRGRTTFGGNVNLICSGEKAGKGFVFEADPEVFKKPNDCWVFVKAGKTLDLSELSFEEGVKLTDKRNYHVCLDMGSTYKQGDAGWDNTIGDELPGWACDFGYEMKKTVRDGLVTIVVVPEGTLWVTFFDAEVTDASVTNNIREFTTKTETFALPTSNEVQAVENMLFLGWTNYAGTVVTQIVQGTTKDVDVYAVWESLYKVVTFTTNGVENVVATTNIYKGTALTEAEIPEIFATLKGAWDIDPVGATITCDTNFNFKISAGGWEQAESAPEGAKASEVWGDEIPAALAGADAKKLAKWAEDNGIAFEDGATIKPEAFLLNCANDEAAIEAALTEFKFVKVLPEEKPVEDWFGDDFKYNGTLTILGSDDLVNWVEAKATHHFFKGVLSF